MLPSMNQVINHDQSALHIKNKITIHGNLHFGQNARKSSFHSQLSVSMLVDLGEHIQVAPSRIKQTMNNDDGSFDSSGRESEAEEPESTLVNNDGDSCVSSGRELEREEPDSALDVSREPEHHGPAEGNRNPSRDKNGFRHIHRMHFTASEKAMNRDHVLKIYGEKCLGRSDDYVERKLAVLKEDREKCRLWARHEIDKTILRRVTKMGLRKADGKKCKNEGGLNFILKNVKREDEKKVFKILYRACYYDSEKYGQTWQLEYEDRFMLKKMVKYIPGSKYIKDPTGQNKSKRVRISKDGNGPYRGCVARIVSEQHKGAMRAINLNCRMKIFKNRSTAEVDNDNKKQGVNRSARKKGWEATYDGYVKTRIDAVHKTDAEELNTEVVNESTGLASEHPRDKKKNSAATMVYKEQDQEENDDEGSGLAYLVGQNDEESTEEVIDCANNTKNLSVANNDINKNAEKARSNTLHNAADGQQCQDKMKHPVECEATSSQRLSLANKAIGTLLQKNNQVMCELMQKIGKQQRQSEQEHEKENIAAAEIRKGTISKRKKKAIATPAARKRSKKNPAKTSNTNTVSIDTGKHSNTENQENVTDGEENATNSDGNVILAIVGHTLTEHNKPNITVQWDNKRNEDVYNVTATMKDEWEKVMAYCMNLVTKMNVDDDVVFIKEMLTLFQRFQKTKRGGTEARKKLILKLIKVYTEKTGEEITIEIETADKANKLKCSHHAHDLESEINPAVAANGNKLDGVACNGCQCKMVSTGKSEKDVRFRPSPQGAAYMCKDIYNCSFALCNACFVKKLEEKDESSGRASRRGRK